MIAAQHSVKGLLDIPAFTLHSSYTHHVYVIVMFCLCQIIKILIFILPMMSLSVVKLGFSHKNVCVHVHCHNINRGAVR
jgi:hypothetical protein